MHYEIQVKCCSSGFFKCFDINVNISSLFTQEEAGLIWQNFFYVSIYYVEMVRSASRMCVDVGQHVCLTAIYLGKWERLLICKYIFAFFKFYIFIISLP